MVMVYAPTCGKVANELKSNALNLGLSWMAIFPTSSNSDDVIPVKLELFATIKVAASDPSM